MTEPQTESVTLLLRAARFVCERHAGQSKKRQQRSIIDHCLEVAILVCETGLPVDVVAAAILHDTVEKTDTKPQELEAQFGPRVRALVEAVTDVPGESDHASRARLGAAPPEAQTIKCADIVSNLEALAHAGELTTQDLEDKVATLAVLAHADVSLTDRAKRMIERSAGE